MTHDTTDLTNYYTGRQVDTKLSNYLSKTEASNNYYNKSEVDKKLTAASQNNSSGIFIGKFVKGIACDAKYDTNYPYSGFIYDVVTALVRNYQIEKNCIAIPVAIDSEHPNCITLMSDANGNGIYPIQYHPYYLSKGTYVMIHSYQMQTNSYGSYRYVSPILNLFEAVS